ncbi:MULTISPECIES: hypothetical protein [unclassified Pseudoalteromonas]|uniref:hypothetical protein n=1 Tax=unclassified Pseudoalteromonas TaxID=194690 RepID=UPI0005AB6FFE|nr:MULTISPECIES: hypothetical protein [unclassified Pseudoalteromonas]
MKTDASQLVKINLEDGTETVLDINKIGHVDNIKQIKAQFLNLNGEVFPIQIASHKKNTIQILIAKVSC